MKAADRLAQQLGANIDESMGAPRTANTSGTFMSPVHGGPGSLPVAVVHGGPDKYQGSSRIKDALAIELDRIVPDPDQPRKEFEPEALESLSDSLRERGQLQPIRVRWSGEIGHWVIVSGERRWRAARMAGLLTIACIEAKGELTPEEILEDQLVENCIREDLKPIEQAKAFRSLLDIRGCSARQLAESLRISHQAVGRALTLLTLPEELQRQVDAGIVPASAASEVAKVKDESVRSEIAEKIATGKLTRDEAVEAVRKAASRGKGTESGRRGKTKAKTLPTERTTKAPGGVKVVVSARKGLPIAAWADALRYALQDVEAMLAAEGDDQAAA